MKLNYITTTYKDNVKKTSKQSSGFLDDNGLENQLINIYPQMKYQTIKGFGGALTDSAGYIYSLMDDEQKKEMIKNYFGKEQMEYSIVRIPIDSCDFSLEHYEADSYEDDDKFEKFSFERVEKYIIPLLDDVEKEYGDRIEIMLSPWSPPKYMKTNGERNHGGKIKPEYKERWAEYICRYIKEYRNRGYKVTKLTMQNEPKAIQPWDSCVYIALEQKEFLKDYMWPALEKNNLTDIDIYIWDHNKERAFEWAETIIDEETTHMIKGIAFHWYSGDHFEALKMIKERFPDKELLLSEACIEYSKYAADDYLGNAQKYAHDIIGNINNGMSTFLDWNIVLDEIGGPNHVGNFCDAPYLYDTKKKQLIESNICGHLWHFCHFIKPDSVRIGISRYTDELEVTAVKNDNNIVLVILNRTTKKIPAFLRLNNECAEINVEPLSISTAVIEL